MQHAPDVILRSSDKKLLYSWKNFLSFASPVFGDMFTLPQPDTSDNVDGLPVIDLEENSHTLSHVLTLCHPPSCSEKRFKVSSVGELQAVLEATMKYDMGNVRRVALEELSNPSVLRENPLGIYALACLYGCHEVAQLAAKHTLALPSVVHRYVPELEKIHAGKLCRLLLYREACATAARSRAANPMWIVYEDSSPLFGCDGDENLKRVMVTGNPPSRKRRSQLKYVSVHKWWVEYMKRSECALQRWPHGDAVRDQRLVNDMLTAISTSKCTQCKASQVSEAFQSFVNIFAENIERRVAEVEISLGF